MRRRVIAFLALAVGATLAACSRQTASPPTVVTELTVTIDANNDCTLESKRVECAQVASVIRLRHPTSSPRVDICLDKGTRYEAALEVMNSVSAAGFTVGRFGCKRTG